MSDIMIEVDARVLSGTPLPSPSYAPFHFLSFHFICFCLCFFVLFYLIFIYLYPFIVVLAESYQQSVPGPNHPLALVLVTDSVLITLLLWS